MHKSRNQKRATILEFLKSRVRLRSLKMCKRKKRSQPYVLRPDESIELIIFYRDWSWIILVKRGIGCLLNRFGSYLGTSCVFTKRKY